MGKTIKDILALAAGKLGDNTVLKKAIEAEDITKVTFEDNEFTAVQSAISQLLTPDAALNNPELIAKYRESINPQIKKDVYGTVENELKEVAGKLGLQFEGGEQVKDMLKKLKEYQPPKPKAEGDIAKYQQEIDMLNKQVAKVREEKEREINSLKTEFENTRRDQVISAALGKYKLAEPYEKDLVKKGIFETVKNQLYGSAVVKVNENNEIELYQKDMPDKFIYTEANKRMTFDDFVTPLMQDFVKKSEPPARVTPPGVKERTQTSHENTIPPNSMAAELSRRRAEAFKS